MSRLLLSIDVDLKMRFYAVLMRIIGGCWWYDDWWWVSRTWNSTRFPPKYTSSAPSHFITYIEMIPMNSP